MCYVPQQHYYVLHYSYVANGKTINTIRKVAKIEIKYNKFVIIENQYKHTVMININNITATEEVTEDL